MEHSITIKVSKTCQEKQFEPFQIQIEETKTFSNKIRNVNKAREDLYNELVNQLDALMDDRLNSRKRRK